MKTVKKFFEMALCGAWMGLALAACSEEEGRPWQDGSKVDLPAYRSFILCEGQQTKNNSHLFFCNPATHEVMADDIYELQNGQKLGDTANDLIAHHGDLYVVVNVSEVLLRLNGAGVEQARYEGFEADGLGQPRNVVGVGDKIYVTCYGGYVARFDARTLAFEAKVAVDANPEQIVAVGDSLYCINSGYGAGHTLSAISTKTFDVATPHETYSNGFGLQAAGGNIYVMAYDEYYNCHVGRYDIATTATTDIAYASRMLAWGDRLYMANATSPDWVNYSVAYSVYDATAGTVSDWTFSNAPEAVVQGFAVPYFMTVNPIDGQFYIGFTDYWTEGVVYRFDASGRYQGDFTVPGLNPNGMVFLAD